MLRAGIFDSTCSVQRFGVRVLWRMGLERDLSGWCVMVLVIVIVIDGRDHRILNDETKIWRVPRTRINGLYNKRTWR